MRGERRGSRGGESEREIGIERERGSERRESEIGSEMERGRDIVIGSESEREQMDREMESE